MDTVQYMYVRLDRYVLMSNVTCFESKMWKNELLSNFNMKYNLYKKNLGFHERRKSIGLLSETRPPKVTRRMAPLLVGPTWAPT